MEGFASQSLPPKALETQRRLREEKERMAVAMGGSAGPSSTVFRKLEKGMGEKDGKVLGELRRKTEEKEREEKARVEKERGLLEKVWMGNEGDDWKAKRDQREKEALEDGRGYGGLIMDQIWEVWSWGKAKAEDVKEVDEKVVKEENGVGKAKK